MTEQQKQFLNQIKKLNLEYQKETEYWLLQIYHLILHDRITLDDVCDIGERYGLDIEKSYGDIVDTFEDDTEEDV